MKEDAKLPGNEVDPYRFVASSMATRSAEAGRVTRKRIELVTRIQADERRAKGWLALFVIAFLVAGVIRIPAVGPTAWSTWMTNWQSNLCLYASLLSLVLSARHGIRSAIVERKLRKLGD